MDLALNSYYFAGTSGGNIYLGNVTTPLLLTAVDTALNNTHVRRIHLDSSNYPFRNLQMQVKGSFYYLYDGSIPVIYRGILDDTLAHTISYMDAFFTQLAIVDSSSFAIRTQSSQNRQYMLADINLHRNPKLQMHPLILEKQVDGVFDSDGKLVAEHNSLTIIYTYTYRNQFIVMDRNLNVQQKLNTIDTTTTAKIQTHMFSDGTHKMSAPPLKVNGFVTVNRQLLFNHSRLKGKYESTKAWKRASVIDIYRTDRQQYTGSFYVDNRNGESLSQMLATDQYLYVLSGNELVRYRFREPIAKYFKAGEAENLIE
ncbi:hypothetical protein [Chryseobacterium populi]|uniref:hypothetical protein n=1 Tax=Chryseobacterium populi TaxID=1144316 RepID=UPI001EE64FB1|nr:hypothetical protein [Chryseobacterium populi]